MDIPFDDDMFVDFEVFDKIMDKLSSMIETENYICFSLTENGIACGPICSTVYLCIDMNFCK